MKKEIITLLAAAGLFAGCQDRSNEYNEPAGADRPMRTNEATTNEISAPSGASTRSESGTSSSSSSSQQSDSQQPQSGNNP